MKESEEIDWLKEYEIFLKAPPLKVPGEITSGVFSLMQDLMNPSAWTVFFKILGIHLAVGFLSLGVCHQFGMNPFGTDQSLHTWFMSMWGHSTCMIVCGGLFVSATVLTAGYMLSVEEVRALKRTEFIQCFSLVSLSLVLFAIFGAHLGVQFSILWLMGGLVGGLVATEVVWQLKRTKV